MKGKVLSFFHGEGAPRKRINRAPSTMLARGLPWVSVMLASLLPGWALIASAPVMPPFGFLVYVGWRQLRPGLLPVWAGLPLGLFDDLYSGQPFGAAIMLWSAATIVLDVIEARLPWRNFFTEWLVAMGLIVAYIILGVALANLSGAATPFRVIVPQIVFSILSYPLVGRFVAAADRFRLIPFKEIR
ncbi:rod shape-determining protein MreD [Novosphingobium album (ex Liu et al. 2023)]|uniref:Rod shape-determining protein MreD n=1 Tax=Novosphingobium album (ex Liu et al. 2023) TaxID=3031130 RepID=A0ABT5WTX1_9SPHN|nr:rod shape-determining protein MreD [Novosphingobium album (ex Liu et al. 2023)]MDE8653345.1 rod shape-determining protein MreD [Novosphingobium album (ex Liu et al. 2023)]